MERCDPLSDADVQAITRYAFGETPTAQRIAVAAWIDAEPTRRLFADEFRAVAEHTPSVVRDVDAGWGIASARVHGARDVRARRIGKGIRRWTMGVLATMLGVIAIIAIGPDAIRGTHASHDTSLRTYA